VVFSLRASFGTESFWLEHDFAPSNFKLPYVCFYLAFGHLNGFFFAFKPFVVNALIKGRLINQVEMCLGLYMMSDWLDHFSLCVKCCVVLYALCRVLCVMCVFHVSFSGVLSMHS
jgi:hypothetical protein